MWTWSKYACTHASANDREGSKSSIVLEPLSPSKRSRWCVLSTSGPDRFLLEGCDARLSEMVYSSSDGLVLVGRSMVGARLADSE
jgi:hypothetical protein